MDGAGSSSGSGSLSRLRDVLRRQRKDSDPTSETPDIDFEYTDSDSLFHELAELYCYSEIPELHQIKVTFERGLLDRYSTSSWLDLMGTQQKAYIQYLMEKFEVVSCQERLDAVRSMLYLAHGNFMYGIDESDMNQYSRANILMMIDAGVFPAAVELLALEKELGRGVYESNKGSITIASNVSLRCCLSLLYVMVEVMRREDPLDSLVEVGMREKFILGLVSPVYGDDNLVAFLFRMLLNFCNGSMPHYPIRKILLLIWKTILASLGGLDSLAKVKEVVRERANLPPKFREVQPAQPLMLPTPAYDPRANAPRPDAASNSLLPGLISRPLSMVSETDGLIVCGCGKGLDFRPKTRRKDVENFIENCRAKFGVYESSGDSSEGLDVTGLPEPIQESIGVLQEHIYVSLAEAQIQEEEMLLKQCAAAAGTKPVLPQREGPTEQMYKSLLFNLPQYMIAILKVLLAAAPSSKTKNESLNIFVDVLPPDSPMTMIESAQNSVDVNRHKEVIVKAVSATLLLLLKHFKVNHVYQFEFMSQHLVFANCIPLILKFFNQNVTQYVTARNNFLALNFPGCVLIPGSGKAVDMAESAATDIGYSWRNLFSCINLIRILQKLTKWKHSRTVMLVVFKSAPILKRALKVRHSLMQLYVLKLLKVQTKYLGRNWRKSNMKIISAIYRRVRHHLHDDWAYGNDLDAKPWDFQTEEFALKTCVEHFNSLYYDESDIHRHHHGNPFGSGELSPIDCNYLSVLGEPVELSQSWKEHYEQWLEVEVFQHPKDWDKVLSSPLAHLEAKSLES